MNQLSIAFTLYYPTAAQSEAYLGFVAMLSISISLFYLTLPMWRWHTVKTIHHSSRSSWPVLPMALNPVGSFALGTAYMLGIHDASNLVIGWMLYLVPPVIGLFIFSAIT